MTIENGTLTDEVRWLKPEQILIGEDQPRKHFDKLGLEELVESFRQNGFRAGLSRLLVRPLGEYRIEQGEAHYFVQRRMNRDWETVATAESEEEASEKLPEHRLFELVCGERRLRASEMLELKSVPAVVEEMDDRTVLEMQLVENLQRNSLNAMEEALGYSRLISSFGESREEVARKVGKSVDHVDRRLALCCFEGTPVAAAIERGEITPRHGNAIASVPSPALQLELLEKVLHPPDGSSAPWPLRALEATIKLDYRIDLRSARFNTEDPELVPVEMTNEIRQRGGACTDCPFKFEKAGQGNRPWCTNPECFRMKEEAHHERWREKVKGVTLPHAENAELWNESGKALAFHSPYVDLDLPPEAAELRGDVLEDREWAELIAEQDVPLVCVIDGVGKVHHLVERDLAKKAAHLNGHKIFKDSKQQTKLDDAAAGRRPAKSEVGSRKPVESKPESWVAIAAIICEELGEVRWPELALAQLAELAAKAIVREYESA